MTITVTVARRILRSLEIAGSILAIVAMIVLAVRAAARLEVRWDTFLYHLPFAARMAGLGIPYQFSPYIEACYQGFPSLGEFIQGWLWRLTGSINATGIVNYLAFLLFLMFAWRNLGARLWLLVILCLTAPLVLIHAASSYVDLFSNALLAIGVTGFLAMLLFDRWFDRKLMAWTLAGIAAAAWSKYTTMPMVMTLFLCLGIGYLSKAKNPLARRALAWTFAGLLLALTPYAKNLVLYHNPTWPGGLSALKGHFPTVIDTASMYDAQTPELLTGASQPELFFRSLFEVGHPSSYPDRPRWIIDQGNAEIAFRSGGFWWVAVITGALSAIALGFLSKPRHGWIVVTFIVLSWGLISPLPQSHELRYFMFLPLSVAAIISMLFPRITPAHPAAAAIIVCLVLGEFIWVSNINRVYYSLERIGYLKAADLWNASPYWSSMEQGKTYCAVGVEPIGFLLTGPTMHNFNIVDRLDAGQCPAGTTIIEKPE